MTSLCFDTLLVNNYFYDDEDLNSLFGVFAPHDVKNFIFLSDFDFNLHTLSLKNERNKNIQANINNIAPRGIHAKLYHNLHLDQNATLNKDIRRLIAVKKHGTIFVTLPFLNTENYNDFAYDINRLLYGSKLCPVFLDFDKFIRFSDDDISSKLLQNQNAIFAFDINYLFSPENISIVKNILLSRALIIPTVSNHISEYVATEKNINFFIDKIGKKNYALLSAQIRKSISKLS